LTCWIQEAVGLVLLTIIFNAELKDSRYFSRREA